MYQRILSLLLLLATLISATLTPAQHPLTNPAPTMVLISDALSRREISAFSSFIREDATLSARFSDSSANVTVLAPLNAAVAKLPYKPWERPEEYAADGPNVYSGDGGAKRAQDNLAAFVKMHVVPVSPWKGETVKTLAGREVWWEMKEGKMVIQPDGVFVQGVADKVANGELWTLESVLKA